MIIVGTIISTDGEPVTKLLKAPEDGLLKLSHPCDEACLQSNRTASVTRASFTTS